MCLDLVTGLVLPESVENMQTFFFIGMLHVIVLSILKQKFVLRI